MDNNGHRLAKNHAQVLQTKQKGSVIEKEVRELFSSKIHEDADYLMVYPEIVKSEQDTAASLDHSAPFTVKSNGFDYAVNVSSVKQNENKLVMDYEIENIDKDAVWKDIFQNFADFIMLTKSKNIVKDENGELDMQQSLENGADLIRSTKAIAINDDRLHFQSTFTLENPDSFQLKDYSNMVPFGTLSAYQPVEMDPVKVELSK